MYRSFTALKLPCALPESEPGIDEQNIRTGDLTKTFAKICQCVLEKKKVLNIPSLPPAKITFGNLNPLSIGETDITQTLNIQGALRPTQLLHGPSLHLKPALGGSSYHITCVSEGLAGRRRGPKTVLGSREAKEATSLCLLSQVRQPSKNHRKQRFFTSRGAFFEHLPLPREG